MFFKQKYMQKTKNTYIKKQEKELQGLKKIHLEDIEFNIQDQHYIK